MKKTWLTRANEWSRKHVSVVTIAAAAGTVAAAMGTVALCFVTWTNVSLTSKQVDIQSKQLKNQELQFSLVYQAKISPKYPDAIAGEVNKGIIQLENKGNLPARNFRLIWKVARIEGDKVKEIYPKRRSEKNILSQGGIEKRRQEKVSPEDIIAIPYESDFKTNEEVVFLVAAWEYKNQGIESYMVKDSFYLWDIYKKEPTWVYPYWIGSDHLKAINSLKHKLRQFLEKEN